MRKIILTYILFIISAVAMAGGKAKQDTLRISILGDSYSTFEGYLTPDTNYIWYFKADNPKRDRRNDVRHVEETWWHQVIERLHARLEVNNSFSGSTICYKGYNRKQDRWGDYSDRAFCVRSNKLGDPDIIFIFGGTNDSWAGSPIGEYLYGNATREQLFTFRPAMAQLLADLLTNYPQARLLFILNTELKPSINESVHTICRHYGVQCLDLHDIDKQHGHPSVKGMKQIAEQVIDTLKKQVR